MALTSDKIRGELEKQDPGKGLLFQVSPRGETPLPQLRQHITDELGRLGFCNNFVHTNTGIQFTLLPGYYDDDFKQSILALVGGELCDVDAVFPVNMR